MPFYLSEYIGAGTKADPFRAIGWDQPGFACIDIRATGLNAALIRTTNPFSDPKAQFLGDDKLEGLTNQQKNFIRTKLNVDVDATTTIRDAIARIMTLPPANGWKPLKAAGLRYEIWLGELIWKAPFISGGSFATDSYTRADGAVEVGVPAWIKRTGGSGTPNSQNVSSNKMVAPGDSMYAYSGAAATADQYCQLVDGNLSLAANGGPAVRVSTNPGEDKCYNFDQFFSSNGAIVKWNGSTSTVFNAGSAGVDVLANPVKITVQGSTLRLYYGGVEVSTSPGTDTALTTGQPGVMWYGSSVPNTADDWEGGDLAAPPADDASIYFPRWVM